MDLRTALLLPGQGAYRPGVFAGPRTAPVTELLGTVDAVAAEFGRGAVSPLLTDPDAPDGRRLSEVDPFALQLAIFAAALVYAADVDRRRPADVVLGHSMGEMAAAVHTGCFTVADGARLVAHRARALEQTAAGAGGMLAVTLSARRAAALVTAAELPGVRLAVVNAPRHTVVSGPEADLGVYAALADVLRVRAIRLPAPYPFHHPLLATAQAEFAAAIEGIQQRPATTRLYSPALGALVTDDTDVKAVLVAQLTRPVDFLASLRDLQNYGLESVVECGRAGLSDLVTSATGCASQPAERWLKADRAPAEAGPAEPAAPAAAMPPAGAAALSERPASASGADAPMAASAMGGPVPGGGSAVAGGVGLAVTAARGARRGGVVNGTAEAEAAGSRPQGSGEVGSDEPVSGPGDGAAGSAPLGPPGGDTPPLASVPEPGSVAAPVTPTASAEPAAPATNRPATVPAASALPAAAQPATTSPPGPAATAAQPPAGAPAVLAALQQIYADRLGYPLEAMDPDADLEGDLGIDSLKRMEILSTLIDRFELHHVADDTRFALQSTLGGLAELIVETRTDG